MCAVHPHGCGEHQVDGVMIPREAGSSPRVWGTPQGTHDSSTQNRFIPTGVGNTIESLA